MPATSSPLPSDAERRAAAASDLPAFGGFSLTAARRDLIELLGSIRSNGMFQEYTKHDIAHVDAMLTSLTWIIPAETREILTTADWLLITLSAYLHDLGMLVTNTEFNHRRDSPSYLAFEEQFRDPSGPDDKDFAARIAKLEPDQVESFLYQEYVRANHAKRIRSWIDPRTEIESGDEAKSVKAEVHRILASLEIVFLDDLAKVCESHHLEDLDDHVKYPVIQPYGSDPQETANVQYAAVILRTMDLMDITRDRTPAIAFRIINPQDPISQREWARHQAVRQVRSKEAVNDEGVIDPDLPRDTVEVYARYDDAEGYFALTAYLDYAQGQLRQSNDWITQSNKVLATKEHFPWRYIDSSHVEAVGFVNRPFEFTLDHEKILELLTGHTLYNDSGVVLRELLQNSLDAVRLAHGDRADEDGEVVVRWNSVDRTLIVFDNGVGMTQEVVERNFLRVGASYYQEPRFKRDHPEFTPISRFGIGVLSTFMVADEVQVTTCHSEEPQARRIELRTVHGKYLIRLLDKTVPEVADLTPHGTAVRLVIRPSVQVPQFEELAKEWVVVPGCSVKVIIDEREPIQVGYNSVRAALVAALEGNGVEITDAPSAPGTGIAMKVVERTSGDVSVAYALTWSRYFREWQFVVIPSGDGQFDVPQYRPGLCAGGIRVLDGTPGYAGRRQLILALGNVVGRGSPRTNVARSNFEITPEYQRVVGVIYALYCAHVTEEIHLLQSDRNVSLTYATNEGPFLANPIPLQGALFRRELQRALSNVPLFLIEEDGVRSQVSAVELLNRPEFWTVHGAFSEHIEYLLREVEGSSSFTKLLEGLGVGDLGLPSGPLLCTDITRPLIEHLINAAWTVAELRGSEERRRCEARWVRADAESGSPTWSATALSRRVNNWRRATERIEDRRAIRMRHRSPDSVHIPLANVMATGFENGESGVAFGRSLYLLPNTPWMEAIPLKDGESVADLAPADLRIAALCFVLSFAGVAADDFVREIMPVLTDTDIGSYVDLDRYVHLLRNTRWTIFDTKRWQRDISSPEVSHYYT